MIEHIKKWVEDNQNTILDVFTHFHENPEISWKEKKTKEYIIREAEQLGFHYKTFDQHYGVVLNWDGDTEGSTVALRTDMDALWQNVGGTWRANHSCGHDAHMTMVLLAARCLKEIGYVPVKGKIKFIFQPAEESGKGAIALLNDGVIDDVDYLLGVHVRPKVEMEFGQVSAGIYHGAAAMLKGRIKGIQAHGARPNQGINVIDSLGSIIYAVNSIKVDPTIPCSAKVTQVQAGGSNINIIPDDAEFSIDVRAQTNEALEDLLKKV
ncbi:MAG TPA: amidohydrolase, partial [Pseudoneobacillus sp.]|nr:amidohydrolase [Pseudoneobacillus sp.]